MAGDPRVKVSDWVPRVTLKDFLGLPPLPTLNTNRSERGHATKVDYGLTEQVKLAVGARYKGLKLTKKAALEMALAEWLVREVGSGRAGR